MSRLGIMSQYSNRASIPWPFDLPSSLPSWCPKLTSLSSHRNGMCRDDLRVLGLQDNRRPPLRWTVPTAARSPSTKPWAVPRPSRPLVPWARSRACQAAAAPADRQVSAASHGLDGADPRRVFLLACMILSMLGLGSIHIML